MRFLKKRHQNIDVIFPKRERRGYRIVAVMFWRIFALVVTIMLVLYLIGFFYCFALLHSFKKKLKKRIVGVSIVFSEKKELLLALDAYYRDAKMEYEEEDLACVREVASLNNGRIKEADIPYYRDSLQKLEKRLRFKADSNSWIKAGSDYETMTSFLTDLNKNYRRIVAIYNSDLLGYEYWRRRWPYHYLFVLLGFRKKERLN